MIVNEGGNNSGGDGGAIATRRIVGTTRSCVALGISPVNRTGNTLSVSSERHAGHLTQLNDNPLIP